MIWPSGNRGFFRIGLKSLPNSRGDTNLNARSTIGAELGAKFRLILRTEKSREHYQFRSEYGIASVLSGEKISTKAPVRAVGGVRFSDPAQSGGPG
jgi:hypothetical protein